MPNSNKDSIDLNKAYVSAKDVVSRRNQDGTIILMRLDETSLFYKIDGIAAMVWAELENAKTPKALCDHFQNACVGNPLQVADDIHAFLANLANKKLVMTSPVNSAETFKHTPFDQTKPYLFGTVKEFNLEQIEAEVLNESIYLDVFAGSDLRLKKDVEPIRDAVAKIKTLEGITYQWDLSRAGSFAKHCSPGRQVGLVAQQVAEQMPELVHKDEDTSYLAVNYPKMTAYLVEAIKDLSQQLAVQDQKIRSMEAALRKN